MIQKDTAKTKKTSSVETGRKAKVKQTRRNQNAQKTAVNGRTSNGQLSKSQAKNGHLSSGHSANGHLTKAQLTNGHVKQATTEVNLDSAVSPRPYRQKMKFTERQLDPGMGMAVARRTYLRKKKDKNGKEKWETWGEVAERVARGNTALLGKKKLQHQKDEYKLLKKHIANGSILMSGRHLQHGDETQPGRNMEVFTNCLEKNTKILTQEYGPIEIGKLAGKTITVKAADGEWRQAEAKSYGKQKLYKITFVPKTGTSNYSHTVVATRNHRWFLEDGSVTDNLQVDDSLDVAPQLEAEAPEGIQHGLIFGDGSAHKSRKDYPVEMVSQGREYPAIRLCGADKKYLEYFEDESVSYPPHANGDPVVYVGRKSFLKDLPYTLDSSYIAGFIKGWWMADGSKTLTNTQSIEISTVREDAIAWLEDYAAYAGYIITSHRIIERKEQDGSYKNGKPLHCIRLSQTAIRKVASIEPFGEDEVYCVEEPVTTGFVLANGLLTGNCSTASNSYLLFYLLMNGSGVGRAYDDDMCIVDWDNMPNLRCVLSDEHPDFEWGKDESVRDAEHKYGHGDTIHWFEVPDSREGWAQAVELLEVMAFEKKFKNDLVILDFSKVRAKGAPIHGMQDRPASGPKPLMNAIERVATVKGAGMSAWKQAIFVDHYLAECVLVGGARRSARIATKVWTDPEVLEFINIKRGGFLWSANNSVAVDEKFWEQKTAHARKVLKTILEASYHDGTGEPGFVNQHMLVQNDDGYSGYSDGKYAESKKYKPMARTEKLLAKVARNAGAKVYHQIPNPCGEITLNMLGGYCVIGDVVPFFAPSLDAAEEAFRAVTRALIRVNLMDSLYNREVKRTNRIGVGMTGIHEFAWNAFGYDFNDLIDEDKSKDFWLTLNRFKRAVDEEATKYAKTIGVNVPHTNTTIKPSGTVSKLFALTEGAHLPSMREYIRWVQYRSDDASLNSYREQGYPVKELKSYAGSSVVGFPTQPMICRLGMEDRLVTAAEASPEDQYKWLMLLEKYWIVGVDDEGNPLEDTGNQVSYTLKYNPQKVAFEEYADMVKKYQSQVKCCSVMPQQDNTAYEYQPEQPVTSSEFMKIIREIEKAADAGDLHEDIDYEHLKCSTGACPI